MHDFQGECQVDRCDNEFVVIFFKTMYIIIKFPYNAHTDWLKQRALSENREWVDDGKLAFNFLLRNFDK